MLTASISRVRPQYPAQEFERVNGLEEMTRFYRDVVGLDVLRQSDTSSVLGAEDTPLLILVGMEMRSNDTGQVLGSFTVRFGSPRANYSLTLSLP